jgi:hypothetical protein
MILQKDIDNSARTKLQNFLNGVANSVYSKTTSVSVQAHSSDVATILITVSGIRCTISKTIVIVKNTDVKLFGLLNSTKWYAYTNGKRYLLNSLNESTRACKNEIQIMKSQVEKYPS